MLARFFKTALGAVAISLAAARAHVAPPAHAGALGQRYIEARERGPEPEDQLFFDHKNVAEVAPNLPIAAAGDVTLGATGEGRGSSAPGSLLGSIDFTRRGISTPTGTRFPVSFVARGATR